MIPRRPSVLVARLLALAVATAAILVPLGRVLWASFHVTKVVFTTGTTVRAAGHVVYERSLTATLVAAGTEPTPDGPRDYLDIEPGLVRAGDLVGTTVPIADSSRRVTEQSETRVWLGPPTWTTPPRPGVDVVFSSNDGRHPAVPGAAINLVRFQVAPEDDPDGERIPVNRAASEVAQVRETWSTAHYEDVWGPAAAWAGRWVSRAAAWLRGKSDPGEPEAPRTVTLLAHSFVVAGGAGLLSLLLGLPVAWLLARADFVGRRVLAVLLAGPLLLPPFFAAMGVSGSLGVAFEWIGIVGGTQQMLNAVLCLGSLLSPVSALLVSRAIALAPAGLVESATLLAGPRAASRLVVVPAAKPAALASFLIAFVISICDFSVPDLLGALLPRGAVPVHVFATEIFLQSDKFGNTGRAVATGSPFAVVVLALVVWCARSLRRCPAGFLGGATRARPRVFLRGRRALVPWLLAAPTLALGFVLPIASVVAWGFSPARIPETIRATAGVGDDTIRWLRVGIWAAVIATATAVVLARAALRGRRAYRPLVGAFVALPLTVPAMVLSVGVILAFVSIPAAPGTLWKGVLVLVGRFLPHATVAVLLAVRAVEPRLEESAALLGAGPTTIATRIWGPLCARGIAASFFLVLVLALRELDALVLVESAILPVRIYDKVHYGRTGAVADLSIAYLAMLLVPAILAAVLAPRRRGAGGESLS